MSEHQAHTEMRSVLFTDLVGSTERRVRIGEERADALRHEHDQLLGEAVAANGGDVVKGLGDGILAIFASAADAVAAAVAIQQAADLDGRTRAEDAFRVRIGLSAGDVSLDDHDVFGVPVIEASRLCAAAGDGEILAAEIVRTLARGRGGFVFEPMGELELKGLGEPLPSCRVVWEPLQGPVHNDVPFPALLSAGSTAFYVGRDELMGELSRARGEVAGGGCRMALLAGEPGVGKTRTAAELAHRAHGEGALVLYGRCDEDLGQPYQPFMEALDSYTEHVAEPSLGRMAGELARLLPELPTRVPGLAPPLSSDARSEEHLLFEATADWLLTVCADRQVVLVLDDLHWAGKPSLLLLLHVLRAAVEAGSSAHLLVLGTYRDTDIDRAHPLSGVLADLRRLPVVTRHAIGGLTPAEVEAFIEAAAGHELDEEIRRLADSVYAETEGNPFFLAEVLRHLVETAAVVRREDRWVVKDPGTVSVPEGVRDVVGRRLSRLSEAANEVLSVAAVVGREVDVELLVELSDLTEGSLLDALDEAVRARLVDETGPDRYRFSHALVRTTLYEEQSATRRRRQHRRVAQALEKLRPDDVVALAYHYLEAGPEGGLMTRAVSYAISAGEQALGARALADAEARFRQVLEVLDDLEIEDSPEHVVALCGLGEAQRDQADPRFRSTLLEAGRRAMRSGQAESLVRAVLANQRGVISVMGDVDPERVQMAEAALELVGTAPTVERARLLAYLAAELVFAGDHRRLALADEAEDLARSIGDPVLLAWVLVRTGFAEMALDRIDRMHARTQEAVVLADASGDPALRVEARFWRTASMLTMGDIAGVRAVTEEMQAIAVDASPSIQWIAGVATVRLLALDGRLDEAEARNSALFADGQEHGEPDALTWWSAISVGIEWSRGNLGSLAGAVEAFADQYPRALTWRAGAAASLAFAGRFAEARAEIERYGLDPPLHLEEPFLLLVFMQLAACDYYLQDRALADSVLRVLQPFEDKWAHWYLFLGGPSSMWLGLCHLVLGNAAEAVRLAERALEEVETKGCRGLVHVMRGYLGVALFARGGSGDDERARDELERARNEALAVGAGPYAELLSTIASLGRDPNIYAC